MPEKELKEYWYAAYAKALGMLQHPEKVTEKEIATCIRKTGSSVFNRLFCLAVWQEVKRIRARKPSMPHERYKDAITDIWRIFRCYSKGDGSKVYWDKLVNELCMIICRYQHCTFIKDLAIFVTLETIKDIWKKKEGYTYNWLDIDRELVCKLLHNYMSAYDVFVCFRLHSETGTYRNRRLESPRF